jgi:predicted amidohydrolase YtcJ
MAARLTAYLVVGIVAATLIAGLIVGAQRDDNDGPVDIIIHNAKVYTAGPDAEMAEAVAIRGNQVLRVGSDREIQRLRRPQTTVIDAKGGAVLPGFADAHAHLVEGGLGLERVELRGAATLEEIQQRIGAWADAHPDTPWVLGSGWQAVAFAGGAPTRQQLDAIVADRPAQMLGEDGRTSWVNTRALRLAGITRKTASPADGTIVKDAHTGEPTGVMRESAVALVDRVVPKPTREDRARAVRTAIDEAHRHGVTSVHDVDARADDFALFTDARRDGDLLLRVYAALALERLMTEAEIGELDRFASRYPDDPLLKGGAVSIDLDGALETRAAAMIEPYANDTAAGTASLDPDDFNRMVRLLDARGWQVLSWAAGDRAVQMSLNAFEHAVRSNRVPARGRRHRVEHVETIDAADVARFGALGVTASFQPAAGTPTGARIDVLQTTLGPARASRAWAYGSIAAAGGRLVFGSDWPHTTFDPMIGLHVAVTRSDPEGALDDSWNPAERIALKAAIDAYTSSAAWASFDEQRKGTLAPGMLADIVVLSEDIFDAPPARLASTRVAFTVFDGKIVYSRDGTTTN